jgi:tetratricopeptide (TPR) repeat protein
MFGKLFKSVQVKATKSDDFMQNLSATKKEVKSVPLTEVNEKHLTDDIKQQILDKSIKKVKTFASTNFLSIINEAKNELETSDKEDKITKDDEFNEVYNNGLYYIHEFTEKPENKDNLKLALEFFSEATTIKKNRAEPYYFLAYICYLIDDIPKAEKYFKISSYLKPEQKYLMSLGRKISSIKMAKRG